MTWIAALFTGPLWIAIGDGIWKIIQQIAALFTGGAALMLAGCLTLVGMVGCGSKDMTQEQWAVQQQRARETVQLAKDTGAIAVVQVAYDGRTGLYAEEQIGISTGVNGNATLLFVPGLTGMVDRLQAALKPLDTKNP